ncbi:MAG: PHP domain-containing protein [Oscillospiraceae bacterium]|nr:PHP domain-containing protein [Oscillospiraceae bacterium]
MRKKPVERAELSCHTWGGMEDGILRPHEWIDVAREAGVRAIAIMDFQNIHGFEETAQAVEELRGGVEAGELDFKVLYGLETVLENGCRVHLLVQHQEGLAQLYRLLELTWQGREEQPFLCKSEINEHRAGLLVGSPGEDGEVCRGILDKLDDAHLEEIAGFYDYLSVLPPQHYRLPSTWEHAPGREVLGAEDLILKTIAIGKRSDRPVAAAGTVRTASQDWGMFRSSTAYDILKEEDLVLYTEEDGVWDVSLPDLLCTEEMLDAFSFLGKELEEEIVIHGPNGLADLCSEIRIVPEDVRCLQPILPKAFQTVSELCREQLQIRYSGTIPEPAQERVEYELAMLQNNELPCSAFLISRRLVQGLQEKGYSIQTIAHSCSFFHAYTYVPYLLGVTTETVHTTSQDWDEGVGVPLELILRVPEECWEECWEDVIAIFAQIFPNSLAVSCENRAGWDEKPSRSYRRIFVPDAGELRSWMPLQKTDNGYRIPYGRAEDFSNLFRVFLHPHRAQVCDTDWENLLEQLGFID